MRFCFVDLSEDATERMFIVMVVVRLVVLCGWEQGGHEKVGCGRNNALHVTSNIAISIVRLATEAISNIRRRRRGWKVVLATGSDIDLVNIVT